MEISVFGMGYVGVVAAACLADDGHKVIGVDPNPVKVSLIERGLSPIVEKDIGSIVEIAVKAELLSATQDAVSAVRKTAISLICVGTPSEKNGGLDLTFLKRVCEDIGNGIKAKDSYHLVVIRSTILPGTMRGVVIPTLERISGKTAGKDFGVCNNPEFLREGTAVWDYRNPPKTVIGELDSKAGEMLMSLYAGLPGPKVRSTLEVAEMVKYVDNVWHATKVAFANEIGVFCKAHQVDSHTVMDIFCQDTKLNISTYYMKPGFAFGGSCLPKDLRALTYKAKKLDLELPLLLSVLESNQVHIERAAEIVQEMPGRRIGVLGFSFKAGTDDMRESPVVELIERLIGKGYQFKLYDNNVNIARLLGSNKEYIFSHIPHLSTLMVDTSSAAVENVDIVLIGNGDPSFASIVKSLPPSVHVVDLIRVLGEQTSNGRYEGICW